MPCYSPIRVNIKRKHSGVLDSQEVGCGHCLGCRSEQGRQTAIRCVHEARMHDYAWFATLTYSDRELPKYGSLCPEDLRGFFKALRGAYGDTRISYVACGEYGENTQRAHYHALLFGPEFLDRRPHHNLSRPGVWRSPTLERCWPHGYSEFGTVSFASAAYVGMYARKKVRFDDKPDHYTRVNVDTGEIVDVVAEFSTWSLRPAIGRRWIAKHWRSVYPRDSVVIDGRESRPPRYYDKFMDMEHKDLECGANSCDEHRELMMLVRERREEEAIEREEISRYTLKAKEAHKKCHVNLFEQRGNAA